MTGKVTWIACALLGAAVPAQIAFSSVVIGAEETPTVSTELECAGVVAGGDITYASDAANLPMREAAERRNPSTQSDEAVSRNPVAATKRFMEKNVIPVEGQVVEESDSSSGEVVTSVEDKNGAVVALLTFEEVVTNDSAEAGHRIHAMEWCVQ